MWWKYLPHHEFMHLIALQFSLLCLLGLSELHSVHRGFGCWYVGFLKLLLFLCMCMAPVLVVLVDSCTSMKLRYSSYDNSSSFFNVWSISFLNSWSGIVLSVFWMIN